MWIAFVVPLVLMVGCVLLERYEHWILRIGARRSAAATLTGEPGLSAARRPVAASHRPSV